MHAYLREAAGDGVAVLLISEDLDEIRALADRVVVIYEGELTGEFDPATATVEEIGLRWPEVSAHVIAVERRLAAAALAARTPSRSASIAVAFVVMAVVLLATGHDPIHTYRRLFDAAFVGSAAWTATLTLATPLLFTGLARRGRVPDAALQHRRRGPALHRRDLRARRSRSGSGPTTRRRLTILAMCVCGAAGGALWALIAGVLKAFARTNEIITTLMLNYVAGLLLTYLIFDSASPWRDVSTIQTRSFPQSIALKPSQFWPTVHRVGVVVPFGFLLALGVAVALWVLFRAHALRVRDERDRRLAAGRPLLGHAHAAEDPRGDGDLRARSPGSAARARSATSRTSSTPARRGSRARAYGYTGIVVAALGRYNPFAVVLVGVLIGGLQNAGLYLQGADFPTGLVGVLQGIILFCTLGGELLDPLPRADRAAGAAPVAAEAQLIVRVNDTLVVAGPHRRRSSTGRRSCSPRSGSCSPSARACSTSASRG